MAIDTKLNTVENGVSGIRDAIQNINSNMGKGHINTLDDDIEKLSNQNNFIHKVLKQAVTETTTDPDTGEETTEVTGYDYVNQSEYVGPNYTAIPASKYTNNTELSEVIIPDSVTSIGNSTFQGCSNLNYTNLENIKTIGTSSFYDDSNLQLELNMPQLISLGNQCFHNTKILKILDLGKVTTIPSGSYTSGWYHGAFSSCKDLKSVVLPDTVKTISRGAFRICTNLETINLLNITSIGAEAFYGDSNLSIVVDIPGLTSLGNNAFRGTGITAVNNIGSITTIDGSDSSNGVFNRCASLQSVNICNVKQINNGAFAYCTSLNTVVGFENITTVSNNAFISAPLTNMDLQLLNCTSVGPKAFYSTNIKSVTFNKCTTINGGGLTGAFQDCIYLEIADLPETLTKIGAWAFGCWTRDQVSPLTMICRATTPPTLEANNFRKRTGTKIYVPYSEDHSILDAYKTATNWSAQSSVIYELNPDGSIPT